MTKRTGSKSVFTGKFSVGEFVKVKDEANFTQPNGRVVYINREKTSHHYQVHLPGDDWDTLWFCEEELQKRDDLEVA